MTPTISELEFLELVQVFVDAVESAFLSGRQPTKDERMEFAEAIDTLQRTLWAKRERLIGQSPSDHTH